MKISTTLQPLIDATRREVPALLKQLRVGQILQARVLGEPQAGLLRLQIATTELLARSRVSITPGKRVVDAAGRPLRGYDLTEEIDRLVAETT